METINSRSPNISDDNNRENNKPSDVDALSTNPEDVRKSPARSIPREEHAAVLLRSPKPLPVSKDAPKSRLNVGHTAKMVSGDGVPSDTQVVSQSVFDDMIRQNKDAARSVLDSNTVERATLMTLHEGDSGHIDLLSGFENTCPDIINVEDNEEQNSSKLGESSPMHFQPNLFPESQRFLTSTPATAFKLGQPERSNSETPCVSKNPLGSDIQSSGGIMGLSQLFKATQAPSSPLVHGQQPDLISDRPSPNLPIQSHRLATALSSPLNALAATFPQDRSETPMAYISMKESQARRERILQERLTRSAEHIYAEDQSDGEFEKEPSFVERIIRQKTVDQEALAQFAGVAAPARASSRRRTGDDETTSPSRKLKQRDQADRLRTPAFPPDSHETDTAFQSGALSEAETEHGVDLARSQPTQQGPSLSTEEDKENCNDDSEHCLATTTSAHDRLSQALSLHDDSSPQEDIRLSRSPDREARGSKAISEIMVVKDSQQSPRREDHGDHDKMVTNSQLHRSERPLSQGRYDGDPSGRDRVISSPTRSLALRSSPPPTECEQDQLLHPAHLNRATTRSRSSSASSHDSSSQLPRDASSAQEVATTQSSNPTSRKTKGAETKSARVDPREKPSSMPSRVAETPVPQRPMSFGDIIPTTSIPETSPSTLHKQSWTEDVGDDPMDQEDDDLPPAYPTEQGRISHSQPLVHESSTPARRFLAAKILSSPSGRQRRALTEIAADASPQAGAALVDVDIGIFTADDKEFSSVVSSSPIPPRKKRRGNGQNVYASDPILPFTPRIASQYAQSQNREKAAGQSLQPEESVDKPESSFLKRSRSSKRMETVWEVEDTPQYHITRKERLKSLSRPRAEADPEPRPLEPAENMNVHAEEREDLCGGNLDVPEDRSATMKDKSPEPARYDDSDPVTPIHGDNSPIALNQVFAPWSGQKRAYYPATCVGKPPGISQSRVLVKFEDTVPLEVPMGAVKRLELKIGDAVKVDMPNVPKVTHIIRGFEDRLSAEDLTKAASDGVLPMTDVYGYTTLLLGPKQRKSLPTGGLTGPDSLIKVPVSRIYLDTILWNQLKDRAFTYASGATHSESRLQTPSDRYSTPASPGSRLQRSIRFLNGIFAGMVFALSYGDNDEAKSRITKMILDNDGSILKDGFNELFELPSDAPLATPTKSPAPGANCNNGQFRLATNAEEAGFACLIADKHSRRPKYMQALALNIPCLSDRWVEDCIAEKRILDWEMYLLPSGESIYLNGATKSRSLAPYPATTARLPDTIAARPNLLKDQSVLLVMGRGGRSDEERRKAYIFLTYALGASKVERVPDLKSARASLDQQAAAGTGCTWDWIYVDGDEMASAKATILGSSVAGTLKSQSFKGAKKRKRTELVECIDGSDLGLSTSVRIVGNEFVCQSLILGRLFGQ